MQICRTKTSEQMTSLPLARRFALQACELSSGFPPGSARWVAWSSLQRAKREGNIWRRRRCVASLKVEFRSDLFLLLPPLHKYLYPAWLFPTERGLDAPAGVLSPLLLTGRNRSLQTLVEHVETGALAATKHCCSDWKPSDPPGSVHPRPVPACSLWPVLSSVALWPVLRPGRACRWEAASLPLA